MLSLLDRIYKTLATAAWWAVARLLQAMCVCGIGVAGAVLALGAALLVVSAVAFGGVILSTLCFFGGVLVFGITLLVVSGIVFCGATLFLG